MKTQLSILLISLLLFAFTPHGNEAEIEQIGDGNEIGIEQIGSGHSAFITQLGNDNVADIEQMGASHEARVSQEGSHEVHIEQAGTGNQAFVEQVSGQGSIGGDGNWPGNSSPFAFQGGGAAGDGSSFAHIEQVGEQNVTSVTQEGSHFADIYQEGTGNAVSLTQVGGASGEGSAGNPGNANPPPFSGGNFPGSANPPPFSGGAETFAAYALLHQEGHDNVIDLHQEGSHYAEITQIGEGNQANVNQLWGDGNGGSYVDIYQNGMFNMADVTQYGAGHSAIIEQFGNGNSATVIQR